MTNASPFFAGKLFSNSHAASYPPAEPPMPTIGQLASLLPSASCAGFDLADVDRLLLLLATVRDAFFFAVRFRGMAFFMLIPVSASDKLSLQSVAAVSDCRNMVRRSLSAATKTAATVAAVSDRRIDATVRDCRYSNGDTRTSEAAGRRLSTFP